MGVRSLLSYKALRVLEQNRKAGHKNQPIMYHLRHGEICKLSYTIKIFSFSKKCVLLCFTRSFFWPSGSPSEPHPQALPDSGIPWDPLRFTFLASSSSRSSSCATPGPPSSPRLWSEHLTLSCRNPLVTPQALENGHVLTLWFVNPASCCRCGYHSTLHWGSRQGGQSSISSVSCTCSWVCPSLQTASWHL